MKQLPFKMVCQSEMEKYRAESFWQKEPETISWIESFPCAALFVDVGANVGVYSLYCAARHPNATVIAFEPFLMNFSHLRANIIANGFDDRVVAYPFAVGKTQGHAPEPATFISPSTVIGSSGGQVRLGAGNEVQDIRAAEVWLTSLDAFFEDSIKPSHVKIDIDGQEMAVIEGMDGLLGSTELQSVLIEAGPETDKVMLHSIMGNHGFNTNNPFNGMRPHSRERRKREGIPEENIIFTR